MGFSNARNLEKINRIGIGTIPNTLFRGINKLRYYQLKQSMPIKRPVTRSYFKIFEMIDFLTVKRVPVLFLILMVLSSSAFAFNYPVQVTQTFTSTANGLVNPTMTALCAVYTGTIPDGYTLAPFGTSCL